MGRRRVDRSGARAETSERRPGPPAPVPNLLSILALSAVAGAGDETCSPCHEEAAASISASAHREVSGHPALRECATCHRGARAHAESARWRDPVAPFREDRVSLAAACGLCHAKRPTTCEETPDRWRERRCLDCHRLHEADEGPSAHPGYSGDASCRPCHFPFFDGARGHILHPTDSPDPPHGGCEACHGPSQAHAATPAVEKTGTPAAGGAACIPCHESDPHLEGWRSSAHGRRRVSCLDCHVDAPRAPAPLSRCETCHSGVATEFFLPSRHLLREGRMTCLECHEPHGGATQLRNEEVRTGTCVACHPEKEGPFVFEHEGDRIRGCLSCHRPHGSPNARLLTHSRSEDLLSSHSRLLPHPRAGLHLAEVPELPHGDPRLELVA